MLCLKSQLIHLQNTDKAFLFVPRDQALPEDLFSEDMADPGEDEAGPAETPSEPAGTAQTDATKVHSIIQFPLPACCHTQLS